MIVFHLEAFLSQKLLIKIAQLSHLVLIETQSCVHRTQSNRGTVTHSTDFFSWLSAFRCCRSESRAMSNDRIVIIIHFTRLFYFCIGITQKQQV